MQLFQKYLCYHLHITCVFRWFKHDQWRVYFTQSIILDICLFVNFIGDKGVTFGISVALAIRFC